MKLVIAGGTGFIGSALGKRLSERGHSFTVLTRRPSAAKILAEKDWVTWEPGPVRAWEKVVHEADGIINLAGEPIARRRWTKAQKEKIRSSRIQTTRDLVAALGKAKERPKFLLNASAVGYYGPRGDEILTEKSGPGDDFLARVCVDWEQEAKKAESYGVRVIRLRTGVVLGTDGGALAKMVPPFKLFVGGPLGTGKQWMSWIHMQDEVGLIAFLIENPDAHGPVNATAPNPVTMEDFCKTLGRVLNRPSWARVPALALRLMLGEMAGMLLTGQRVLPEEAQRLGYKFRYRTLYEALQACIPR